MRLIIHVGFPKAGSTAFQDWCSSSSSLLERYGIYYPGPTPENGAFLCSYLSSPAPESLAMVLKKLNTYSAIAQARNLQALLLSSEQVFEYSTSLDSLATSILSQLKIVSGISVLVISRDFQAIALSSWKQAILASGEKREYAKYFEWLRQIYATNQNALSVCGKINLVQYPYSRPLDFSNVIKLISAQIQQEPASAESLSEDLPSIRETTDAFANQTLPDFCYKFWLSCNRAYGLRAHNISLTRLDLLQTRPVLRKSLLQGNYSTKHLKVLLLIEGSALKTFFLQSPTGKAVNLVGRFMNDWTKEEQQAAVEFLLINEDYLYEPMFNVSHVESIASQMAGDTKRTLRFMDVLEAGYSKQDAVKSVNS